VAFNNEILLLSHVIDIEVFNACDGFSIILSFEFVELVSDAKFANSSLKLFDDKLRFDSVDALLNCVLMSYKKMIVYKICVEKNT
jgi:hypothetical protein